AAPVDAAREPERSSSASRVEIGAPALAAAAGPARCAIRAEVRNQSPGLYPTADRSPPARAPSERHRPAQSGGALPRFRAASDDAGERDAPVRRCPDDRNFAGAHRRSAAHAVDATDELSANDDPRNEPSDEPTQRRLPLRDRH